MKKAQVHLDELHEIAATGEPGDGASYRKARRRLRRLLTLSRGHPEATRIQDAARKAETWLGYLFDPKWATRGLSDDVRDNALWYLTDLRLATRSPSGHRETSMRRTTKEAIDLARERGVTYEELQQLAEQGGTGSDRMITTRDIELFLLTRG